jgi:tripeptide aminopeptidase
MDPERLLRRFLRYVQIDTTAREGADTYPSSPGQLELGELLADELRAMGLVQVEHDEHGLVMATVPATCSRPVPVVALNSHLDTSPETSGKDVRPRVIREYSGGDIPLSGDSSRVIRVAENPELDQLRGATLITTDGTTLLGADDKAGLAIIMETAEHLLEHAELEHGDVRLLFTCDEEIGRGVDHVDLEKLAATVCYTLDGPGAGHIDVETFSADLATVSIRGVNIHPAIAYQRMVNAIKAAAAFVAQLPREGLSPETTRYREGFVHPYVVEGGVGEVRLRVLLRDFDTPRLQAHAEVLRRIAAQVMQQHPGTEVDVHVKAQYRNLGDGLAKEPRAVAFADEAFRRLGYACEHSIIRGGTDGSRLTELGLPTPNLSAGQHNPHSPLEWACLDEMVRAVEVLNQLLQIWAESSED